MSVYQKGVLLYKCRNCSQIYEAYSVPNLMIGMVNIVAGTSLPREWGATSISLVEVHFCDAKTGTMGVADMIGGKTK